MSHYRFRKGYAMNYDEFARMLYQTSIDSTTTSEVAIRRLTPLRNWIKANVPNKLYRYRRPTAYNLDTLRTDEIWGSTILECNDPYECVPACWCKSGSYSC